MSDSASSASQIKSTTPERFQIQLFVHQSRMLLLCKLVMLDVTAPASVLEEIPCMRGGGGSAASDTSAVAVLLLVAGRNRKTDSFPLGIENSHGGLGKSSSPPSTAVRRRLLRLEDATDPLQVILVRWKSASFQKTY